MERKYAITLGFNPNKPYNNTSFKEYDAFISQFKGYLLSLGLFKPDPRLPSVRAGSHLLAVTEDGEGLIDITHPGSEIYAVFN